MSGSALYCKSMPKAFFIKSVGGKAIGEVYWLRGRKAANETKEAMGGKKHRGDVRLESGHRKQQPRPCEARMNHTPEQAWFCLQRRLQPQSAVCCAHHLLFIYSSRLRFMRRGSAWEILHTHKRRVSHSEEVLLVGRAGVSEQEVLKKQFNSFTSVVSA